MLFRSIRTLLLTFFFRYMKELVEKGYVYIAQPPLFKVTPKQGRANDTYLYSDIELERFIALSGKPRDSFAIQRYKGLGEMSHEELWQTTMNPENRTLLQVNMEDFPTAEEMFTVLMGEKVEPRREFIEENACYVQNLDI